MTTRNHCLTAALEELAEAGIHHPQIARGGKHLQVRWTNPHGAPRMISVPGTPSDWRSPENTRRDLRRILRLDGILGEPETKAPPPRQPSRLELLERQLAEVERRLSIGFKETA